MGGGGGLRPIRTFSASAITVVPVDGCFLRHYTMEVKRSRLTENKYFEINYFNFAVLFQLVLRNMDLSP